MLLFIVLLVVAITALLISAVWYIDQPGFEPLITLVTGLGTLIGAFMARPKKPQLPEVGLAAKEHELTESRRRADLRILSELWSCINTDHVTSVVNLVNWRDLEYQYYLDTFRQYMRLRDRPEMHFIDERLERAFSEFDEIIGRFDRQLFDSSSVEFVREAFRVIPLYKSSGLLDQETYSRLIREHQKALELGNEVCHKQEELVAVIKSIFPEFTFPKG